MGLRERAAALYTRAADLPAWGWRATAWSLGLGALAWLQGPALAAHVRRAADPHIFSDDARILIVPFQRHADPSLFPGDRLVDYYLGSLPEAYRLLFVAAARLWDPLAASKTLPYLLLAVLAFALAASALRLAGRAAALGVLALCLGSELYLARMCGGLPRTFAFPLIAGGAAALVYGRPWLLAALVCVGAGTYPVTGAILGLTLAGWMLLPASHRGSAERWSLGRRFVFVGATAVAAGLVLAPTAWRLREWGTPIKPTAFAEFPEAGPGGRFFPEDRPPFPPFHEAAPAAMRKALVGAGDPLLAEAARRLPRVGDSRSTTTALWGLSLLALVGYARLAYHRVEARRLLVLGGAALVGHTIAQRVTPSFFLPQRYVLYTVPVLGSLLLTSSFAGLWQLGAGRLRALAFVPVLAGNLAVLGLFGGRGSPTVGLNVVVGPDERALFDAISRLPRDAMIAGWPWVVDSVPYETNRSVLVSFETSMPFHTVFTKMIRARTEAVIDAYLATSPEPLRSLREGHGVTHLVLRLSHLRGRPPGYFKPFDQRIRAAMVRAKAEGFELERQLATLTVFARGDLVLLDLSRLRAR